MSARQHLFQIEVLDFRHRGKWLPGADNGMGRKEVDRWRAAPRRTLFRRAKTADCAKNWAKRLAQSYLAIRWIRSHTIVISSS